MKQQFIVYFHHTILNHTVIKAYSPAEARYIMEKRMEKKKLDEAGVDSVLSIEREQVLNASRDFTGGPGYGA